MSPHKLLMFACLFASATAATCPAQHAAADEVVAVFNFAQRDDKPQYAWLSKGLADLLINQLSDLPDITVVSRDRMQMLISEYERFLAAAQDQAGPHTEASPVALGGALEAGLVVFGTYAVRDGQVVLAAQVMNVQTEALLFETAVNGPYDRTLELERELSRRIRAHLSGRPADTVPLKDVPQWTTHVGAAEHLYAGVDLFDDGRFADAWLRFRQAARADAAYADAVYWQARMLYYLTLYEIARPLYDAFLKGSPSHPRAGDAAIELIDSARQVLDDPQRLEAVYADVKSRIDGNVMIYNRNTKGTLRLDWYIERLIVNAMMSRGEFDAGADRALELQKEMEAAGYSKWTEDSKNMMFDPYWTFSRTTAFKRFQANDKLVLNRGMLAKHAYRFTADRTKDCIFRTSFFHPDGHRAFVTSTPDGKYVVHWRALCTFLLVAPDGFCFQNIRLTAVPHHEPSSPPVTMCVELEQWAYRDAHVTEVPTDGGTVTVAGPALHRGRFLVLRASTRRRLAAYDKPPTDGIDDVMIMVDLAPLPPDDARIRVRCMTNDRVKVSLDGKYALFGDGVIRGVSPGRHELTFDHKRNTSKPTTLATTRRAVDVPKSGTVFLDVPLEFYEPMDPDGFDSCDRFGGVYPDAKLGPRSDTREEALPCLLRARKGRTAGYLITVWSYRDELWMSTSADSGRTWTPPRVLPVPVNSAHVERGPWLIQDETGLFCMVFLSDRNLQRVFSPYLTTSVDLVRWTAPARLSDAYVEELRIFQDASGRYFVTMPPAVQWAMGRFQFRQVGDDNVFDVEFVQANRLSKEKYGRSQLILLTSRGLDSWESVLPEWGGANVEHVQLLQTDDGRLHAIYAEKTIDDGFRVDYCLYHRWSVDGDRWSDKQLIFNQRFGGIASLSVATDGKRFYGYACAGHDWIVYFEEDEKTHVFVHDYSGLVSGRSSLFFDPVDRVMHWTSQVEDGFRAEFQSMPGTLFHFSFRPDARCARLAEPVNGVNPYLYDPVAHKYYKDMVTP